MLTSIAYLTLLALLLGKISEKMKLPALVGMLIAGIILGGGGLNLLSADLMANATDLRRIALVIILMRAGLALDMESLRKVGRPAMLLSFVPACFEIGAMLFIAPRVLGVSLLDAAIMGSVVAAVSPAVVVPKMLSLIEERRGTAKGIPQMMMAGGSVDDVFVILLFTVFTTLGTGGEVSAMVFTRVPISIVLGVALGVVVGMGMSWFFRAVHLRDTVKLIILMSVAFLMLELESILSDVVAISSLLAVMTMGATLLSRYAVLAKRISPKYSKLWVVAEILLFVLVGATVDLDYAISAGGEVILVLAFVLVWRMAGVFVSLIGSGLNMGERLFCMVAYLPKATVQAAIGAIPLAMGLECGEIVLTMAILSILITAPLGAVGIELCRGLLEVEKR